MTTERSGYLQLALACIEHFGAGNIEPLSEEEMDEMGAEKMRLHAIGHNVVHAILLVDQAKKNDDEVPLIEIEDRLVRAGNAVFDLPDEEAP